MRAVDMVLACQKERTEHRRMLKERRRQCAKVKAFKSHAIVEVESSTSSRDCEKSSEDNVNAYGRVTPSRQKKAKRANTNIIAFSLTGALDQAKFSDRKAMFYVHKNFKSTWKER